MYHTCILLFFIYTFSDIFSSRLSQNLPSLCASGSYFTSLQMYSPVEVCMVWLPLATSVLTHVQCRSQLRVLRGRFCNVKPARRIVPVISGCWCRFLNTHLRRTYPKSIKLSSLNYDLISSFLPSWRRRSEYNTVSGSNSFAEASSV